MSTYDFVGARLDDFVNQKIETAARRRGWHETIVPFTGYGSTRRIRVLARLVMSPNEDPDFNAIAPFINQRGWRNFFSASVPDGAITVQVGDKEVEFRTDRGGYLDVTLRTENMAPGWTTVTLYTRQAQPVEAPILIIPDDETYGLISDIDDTILSTSLPRALLAAWNSFIQTEGNRRAVPGMARMYQQFLADHPNAPVMYVSTGSWATLPFLNRFMERHGFPQGPMLMTDFGPTPDSWFRDGALHKRLALGELARDFPNIRWILIGDNGQHDPVIYRDFSRLRPGRVRAIGIRQLTSAEQLLAHGTATILRDNAHLAWQLPTAPEVYAPDGDSLAPKVKEAVEANE